MKGGQFCEDLSLKLFKSFCISRLLSDRKPPRPCQVIPFSIHRPYQTDQVIDVLRLENTDTQMAEASGCNTVGGGCV